MNASQIKTKIFLIRLVDWLLILTVLGVGIPSIIYSDHQEIAAVGILIGLALVNKCGQWSLPKIVELKQALSRLEK